MTGFDNFLRPWCWTVTMRRFFQNRSPTDDFHTPAINFEPPISVSNSILWFSAKIQSSSGTNPLTRFGRPKKQTGHSIFTPSFVEQEANARNKGSEQSIQHGRRVRRRLIMTLGTLPSDLCLINDSEPLTMEIYL